jgi:23S rRNA pseudouridine2605 synthase
VFSVGRLDANTEGLLLLTNDGDLAQRLTHPSFGVEKEYLAVVEGQPSPGAIRRLRQGVQLDDGMTAPAKVASVPPNTLRITIHEGRKRQVRRMCETVGYPVRRLVRTRIGPLTDRRLRPGAWRPLTTSEVRALESAASTKPAGPKPARSRKPTRTKAARPKPANAKDGTTKAARPKAGGTTKATRNPAGTTKADPKPTRTKAASPKPAGTTKATKKTSTKAAGTNDSTRRPSARR